MYQGFLEVDGTCHSSEVHMLLANGTGPQHTCRCSWKWEHGDSGNTEHTCALKTALCSAPALKTIHVRIGPNTSHAIFLPLLEVQSLRKIYITSYVFNHHRDRRPGHKIDLEAAMIAECTQAFGKRVVMQ